MPKIEKTIDFISGDSFVLDQDKDSNLVIFTCYRGQIKKYIMDNTNGTWEKSNPHLDSSFSVLDTQVTRISGDCLSKKQFLLFEKSQESRALLIPDATEAYSYNSLNRFYYAYDTEILYLNVADSWLPVASMNAKNLKNLNLDIQDMPTITEDEITQLWNSV